MDNDLDLGYALVLKQNVNLKTVHFMRLSLVEY